MRTQSLADLFAPWQGACCSETLDADKGPGLWRTLEFYCNNRQWDKELANKRGHLPPQGKLTWLGGSILVDPGGPPVDGGPSAPTWPLCVTLGAAALG